MNLSPSTVRVISAEISFMFAPSGNGRVETSILFRKGADATRGAATPEIERTCTRPAPAARQVRQPNQRRRMRAYPISAPSINRRFSPCVLGVSLAACSAGVFYSNATR